MVITPTRSQGQRRLALEGSILVFASLVGAGLAGADPCRQEITRTELTLEKARAEHAYVPDMPESNYATMHRQPTVATVANARTEAMQTAEQKLELARKQDAEGRVGDCLKTMEIFALPIEVR